ncbi:S41 family peptidase [Flavobacterium sp. KBS0721]|uniref:S41 family peptidase n=1 Tax=Flavobacterium sp. KBS0721 TaxID=1179672 RepID=UPI00098FA2FE|nr:S41 family peptidase [Flavobacterium sp. KBS0721]QDW21034.1 S41 family peptidase [Flavobacterium sp. KBS0721]
MVYLKKILALCTLLAGIAGTAQQRNKIPNSFWLQEGYGRALAIKDSNYSYYNLDNVSCKALVEGNITDRFSVVSETDNQLVLNPGGIVNYNFNRVDALPSICQKSAEKNTSIEKNFQVFWLTFSDNYAFFRERNVNWQQVYSDYLPKVRKLKTEQEFALLLREIVRKINDGHIRLEIPQALITKTNVAISKPVKSKQEVISDLQNAYVDNVKTYNGGVLQWGFLKNGKTGYISVTDMNNFADYVPKLDQDSKDFRKKYEAISDTKTPLAIFEDELRGVDSIMKIIIEDFKSTEAIVIDLRFNGGGYETVALKLLGYFVTEQKDILSVKAKTKRGFSAGQHYNLLPAKNPYRKKVYLLTGHNTASAAEIFALGTLSYPEIIRIGSPTAGIFSELLWKELPNGWEFSLSNEVYSDSKGKSYEGIGIPVKHDMHYPKDRAAFYDGFYNTAGFADKALEKIYSLEK